MIARRESSPERKEKILERLILRDVGAAPDVALYPNESGKGYTGAIRPQLEKALEGLPAALAIVLDVLNRNRISWGMGVGSPDLFGAVRGLALGLELKTENTDTSPEQRIWHDAARRRGIRVHVVHSVDEARAAIDAVRRGG